MNDGTWTPGISGCGGVFFNAEQGELTVEIEKRDLHENKRAENKKETDLRVVMFGPDRRVLHENVIPGDGLSQGRGPGPAGTLLFKTRVERPGIFGIMITVDNDRNGSDVVWRFRTNCDKYVIEMPCRVPVSFPDLEEPLDVCFTPLAGPFNLELSGLSAGGPPVTVQDKCDGVKGTLELENGTASCEFDADNERDGSIWILRLPKGPAKVALNPSGKPSHDLCRVDCLLWTPDPGSWFDLTSCRWLITPYNRKVYAGAGEEREITFTLQNTGRIKTAIRVEPEFAGPAWDVRLDENTVELDAGSSVDIGVSFAVPEKGGVVYLRVTPMDDSSLTTFATLEAVDGKAPAADQLDLPVILTPFRHENELFGYLPDYTVENQVYFDPDNNPFVRTSRGITALHDGQWITGGPVGPVAEPHMGPWTKIAFDSEDDVYGSDIQDGNLCLLHSRDGGRTFDTCPLPEEEDRRSMACAHSERDLEARVSEIEVFSGHNALKGPPPVMRFTRRAHDRDVHWRKYGDLELILPRKTEKGIEWNKPVLVTDKSLGMSSHSGIPSTVVSCGSKIHVVWGEATAPESDIRSGVPAYAATYDRETGRMGKPVFVGIGRPANDVHNTPCITVDSRGYLHVLTGAHGSQFYYSRSLKPNDTESGFTEPERLTEYLSQTYIGLVCAPDDTLHLAFREWRSGTEYFPNSNLAVLSYMSRAPDGPWSRERTMVVAPFSGYSVYSHRMTIDRKGRLFLSYSYQTANWFYQADYPGRRRALMMSEDNGRTWKLVQSTREMSR